MFGRKNARLAEERSLRAWGAGQIRRAPNMTESNAAHLPAGRDALGGGAVATRVSTTPRYTPVNKRALISARAKVAGDAVAGTTPTWSGDPSALLFPLDGGYQPVNFSAFPVPPGFDRAQCTGDPPDQHSDDDSSEIPLNFTFCLFEDPYTTLWVNNNGVLSFGSFFESFLPLAFPDPALPPLVAPLWSDVDTGQTDTVGIRVAQSLYQGLKP